MPIEPRELLALARRLVGPEPGATEADLRRGISTAYYALFHFLIKEGVNTFVTDPELRPRVARAFNHGPMKGVCQSYDDAAKKAGKSARKLKKDVGRQGREGSGREIAPEIGQVASAFFTLHGAREAADYDDGAIVSHTDALIRIEEAESALRAWDEAQIGPSSIEFLRDLFCTGMGKR